MSNDVISSYMTLVTTNLLQAFMEAFKVLSMRKTEHQQHSKLHSTSSMEDKDYMESRTTPIQKGEDNQDIVPSNTSTEHEKDQLGGPYKDRGPTKLNMNHSQPSKVVRIKMSAQNVYFNGIHTMPISCLFIVTYRFYICI